MGELLETVAGVQIARPADAAALIDEEVFAARDEFLPYWAELWPSARNLAAVIGAADLAGRRVVELGCGLALPALVAARGRADVLATDWAPEAITAARANALRNAITMRCMVLDWRAPQPLFAHAPFDLVLAADVLYEQRHVAPLAELLIALDSEVWLADPGRPAIVPFLDLLTGWTMIELAQGVQRLRPPSR